jgi:hypothetical protein
VRENFKKDDRLKKEEYNFAWPTRDTGREAEIYLFIAATSVCERKETASVWALEPPVKNSSKPNIKLSSLFWFPCLDLYTVGAISITHAQSITCYGIFAYIKYLKRPSSICLN